MLRIGLKVFLAKSDALTSHLSRAFFDLISSMSEGVGPFQMFLLLCLWAAFKRSCKKQQVNTVGQRLLSTCDWIFFWNSDFIEVFVLALFRKNRNERIFTVKQKQKQKQKSTVRVAYLWPHPKCSYIFKQTFKLHMSKVTHFSARIVQERHFCKNPLRDPATRCGVLINVVRWLMKVGVFCLRTPCL